MCNPEVHADLSRGRTGRRLAGLLWGQASNLHAILERNSLVYMQHLTSATDGTSVIRVQGRKQQVMETMSRLHSIADTIESEQSPPPHAPSLSPPPYHAPLPPAVADNADLLKTLALLSQEDKQAWRASHDPQPSLVSRACVEPDMQRKIDYYVNILGYGREKVEATLHSLGPKATVNEIIHRLNKMSSRVPNVAAPGKPSVPVGPADYWRPIIGEYARPIGLEDAGGVVNACERLPRKVDSSKLRPVVIDGSNVAMR